MENEIAELLVNVTDSINKLAREASNIVDIIQTLAKKVVELRTDVDKLIENNQKGAVK